MTKLFVAGFLLFAAIVPLAPAASANGGCHTFSIVSDVCSWAYAGGENTFFGYYYTASGEGYSVYPATVTLTGTMTWTTSCTILADAYCSPAEQGGYNNPGCQWVTTRTAVLVAGTPSYTAYDDWCSGGNLIDPVGLAVQTAADASNAASQAIFG